MKKKLRVGVLASGRGTDLQSIIDASKEGRINAEVALVCSDRDAFCLKRAERYGIPWIKVDPGNKGYEEKIDLEMRKRGVDLIVGAGWLRIISPWFIDKWRWKIINIHPALLPSFKGLHAQRQALQGGVKITGCTTHFMSEELDSGSIILQAAVQVKPDDTQEKLEERILEVEHQLLPRTIDLFEKRKLQIEGNKVKILPDVSWLELYPSEAKVLYCDGY
jgi:phosphoribosylglycinamide formyltransferase-1